MSDIIKSDKTPFRETFITGVNKWGGAAIVSATQVSVSEGSGFVVDSTTNRSNITRDKVNWAEDLFFTVTMPTTFGVQFIYIDSSGVIQQQSTKLTRTELRTKIYLLGVEYLSGTITAIVEAPKMQQSTGTLLIDLLEYIDDSGKLKGALIGAVDAQLQSFREAGTFFDAGISTTASPNDPNVVVIAADGNSTTPLTYAVILQDGSLDSSPISTFPKERNTTGATVVSLTGKRATIHYLASLGGINLLQMGQVEYNDAAQAVAAAQSDLNNFTFAQGFGEAIILAQIVIGNDAADFTDPGRAQILNRRTGSSGGGGGSTFSDAVFRVFNDSDNTKEIDFNATAVATATKRTITMPNANVDLTVTQQATTTLRGTQENATQSEVNTGSASNRNVTPDILSGADIIKNTSAHMTIDSPTVRTYRFRSVGFAGTIEGLNGKTDSGDVSIGVSITGSAVGGLSGLIVDSVNTLTPSTTTKSFIIGDDLEFEITSINTPVNLELTLRIFQTG